MISGSLVATHVVCERLSTIHYHIPVIKIFVPPLKYFRNVGLEYPLSPWKFSQDLALGIWAGME